MRSMEAARMRFPYMYVCTCISLLFIYDGYLGGALWLSAFATLITLPLRMRRFSRFCNVLAWSVFVFVPALLHLTGHLLSSPGHSQLR